MTIKLRNAFFLCALFATLVAFAPAQYFMHDTDLGRFRDENYLGDFRDELSNEGLTDEAVGGSLRGIVSGASRLGNKYSTPIENGAKIFMQGRSGSELNKVVNHAAKNQWSWAPSSRPNPKTDWGARSSRAIRNFFNKDVMEEADELGLDEFPMFGNEDVTAEGDEFDEGDEGDEA
eukprot:g474.t1